MSRTFELLIHVYSSRMIGYDFGSTRIRIESVLAFLIFCNFILATGISSIQQETPLPLTAVNERLLLPQLRDFYADSMKLFSFFYSPATSPSPPTPAFHTHPNPLRLMTSTPYPGGPISPISGAILPATPHPSPLLVHQKSNLRSPSNAHSFDRRLSLRRASLNAASSFSARKESSRDGIISHHEDFAIRESSGSPHLSPSQSRDSHQRNLNRTTKFAANNLSMHKELSDSNTEVADDADASETVDNSVPVVTHPVMPFKYWPRISLTAASLRFIERVCATLLYLSSGELSSANSTTVDFTPFCIGQVQPSVSELPKSWRMGMKVDEVTFAETSPQPSSAPPTLPLKLSLQLLSRHIKDLNHKRSIIESIH